jgi:hypothetical protein
MELRHRIWEQGYLGRRTGVLSRLSMFGIPVHAANGMGTNIGFAIWYVVRASLHFTSLLYRRQSQHVRKLPKSTLYSSNKYHIDTLPACAALSCVRRATPQHSAGKLLPQLTTRARNPRKRPLTAYFQAIFRQGFHRCRGRNCTYTSLSPRTSGVLGFFQYPLLSCFQSVL